jgi:hypothetical protein
MSQANEPRRNEGVAESAQRELTGRVGVPLVRRNGSSDPKGGTSRWRLGKRREPRAQG